VELAPGAGAGDGCSEAALGRARRRVLWLSVLLAAYATVSTLAQSGLNAAEISGALNEVNEAGAPNVGVVGLFTSSAPSAAMTILIVLLVALCGCCGAQQEQRQCVGCFCGCNALCGCCSCLNVAAMLVALLLLSSLGPRVEEFFDRCDPQICNQTEGKQLDSSNTTCLTDCLAGGAWPDYVRRCNGPAFPKTCPKAFLTCSDPGMESYEGEWKRRLSDARRFEPRVHASHERHDASRSEVASKHTRVPRKPPPRLSDAHGPEPQGRAPSLHAVSSSKVASTNAFPPRGTLSRLSDAHSSEPRVQVFHKPSAVSSSEVASTNGFLPRGRLSDARRFEPFEPRFHVSGRPHAVSTSELTSNDAHSPWEPPPRPADPLRSCSPNERVIKKFHRVLEVIPDLLPRVQMMVGLEAIFGVVYTILMCLGAKWGRDLHTELGLRCMRPLPLQGLPVATAQPVSMPAPHEGSGLERSLVLHVPPVPALG